MKITVCDVHLSVGKLVKCRWVVTMKRGFEKIRVHVCQEHEKEVKAYSQGLEILQKAQTMSLHNF